MELSAPWLKYYDGIPSTLNYPDKSMADAVFDSARRHPDKPALIFNNKTISYKKLVSRIQRIASSLLALGVSRGDTVAVCLPNIPQTVYALYAVNHIGAVASLLHPLSAVTELKLYLKELNCKTVITLDILYPKFREVFDEIGEKRLILTSVADELDPVSSSIYKLQNKRGLHIPDKSQSIIHWKHFLNLSKSISDNTPQESHRLAPDSTAIILFSGGTTGSPKGIMLTDLNMNALAMQTTALARIEIQGSSMLAAMPMFHGFGLGICIHTMLFFGGTSILVPKFTVLEYAKLIKRYKPNLIAGVPTLFEALLRTPCLGNTDLGFLKGVFSGGDTLPQALKISFDKFLESHGADVRIREGYGTTECVTASCLTPYNIEKEGSIGIPFPDTFYKICRVGTTEELPSGADGEICIFGPTLMKGYLHKPDETDNVLKKHPDGNLWLHTGDIGMMDEDGFVYFKQRLKRVIITSGYNVYPSQIEEALCSHPAVHMCCAIGVRDPYKMQKVRVYAVLNESYNDSPVLNDELIAYLKHHIAGYAVPKEIVFIDSLPMTKVGKIAYTELEKLANSQP